MRPPDMLSRLRTRLETLSVPVIATLGVMVASGVGAGGYYAYRTYDFVQHDNDFCLSCHLMVEPYELFGQSAHRGLGCKACHQPTLVERSVMGLTQIVENPEEIGVHAEVPNTLCAECHINGDPEKWALIRNSAGHRVHLESADSTLQGLQCVECHSTSLHEFAATDRTCAQSACHADSQIRLGGMSQLTIHCAACHGFNEPTVPTGPGDTALALLAPDQDTCLSCHVMRSLVQLPDPDPHGGACAACHNPHEQATPQQADRSCATVGCHSEADTLTAFHRGIELATLESCLSCHGAHNFHLEGSDCLACHVGIYDDDPAAVRRTARAAPPDRSFRGREVHGAGGEPAVRFASWTFHEASGMELFAPQTQVGSDFLHSEHRDLDCSSCHSSEAAHGAVTVGTIDDCRSCHHVEPTLDPCSSCHADAGSQGDPYRVTRSMEFTASDPVERALPFAHDEHAEEDCASCHTEGLVLSAAAADCSTCHEQHHEPTRECVSCHVEAPESAHPVAQAHATCSGAGCHSEPEYEALPLTRQVCLGCHQDLQDHRPEEPDCSECHALSGAGGAGSP